MARSEDELIQTRVTLLNRLKDWRDHSSWQEFFDIYWKLIYGVARQSGLTEAEAQDVVQETLVCVAKHMPRFKYDPAVGSFKTWLLNMTRWRIIDQARKRAPANHESGSNTSLAEILDEVPDSNSPDWNARWETDWENNLLAAAMARVRPRLDPLKLQLFDFYVQKQWPPERVAQTFKVSVNQVYQAKNRVTEMLREEVKRLENEVT